MRGLQWWGSGARGSWAAFIIAASSACTTVTIIDGDDDTGGGSVVVPPGQGGFTSSSGTSSTSSGAPSTGGAGGEGGAPVVPTNPDPECVPNLELPVGEPVVLGTGLQFPKYLTLAKDHVYVAEFVEVKEPGFLTRVPRTGGDLERVVSGLDRPWHVTTDGDFVYWTNSAQNGSVQRFSTLDGSTGVIQNLLFYPYDIAVYDGQLYVTEESGIKVLPTQSSGTIATISAGLTPIAIAVDELGIYAGVFDPVGWAFPATVHIDADGNLTELYNNEFLAPITVRLDGEYIYLNAGSSIWRGTRDGAPLVPLAEGYQFIADAVVADCFVYFTDHDQGQVLRVPVQGGDVQVLATAQAFPYGLAVDDEAIWWVSSYFGSVLRLDK